MGRLTVAYQDASVRKKLAAAPTSLPFSILGQEVSQSALRFTGSLTDELAVPPRPFVVPGETVTFVVVGRVAATNYRRLGHWWEWNGPGPAELRSLVKVEECHEVPASEVDRLLTGMRMRDASARAQRSAAQDEREAS
jgi:hypothetical protein